MNDTGIITVLPEDIKYWWTVSEDVAKATRAVSQQALPGDCFYTLLGMFLENTTSSAKNAGNTKPEALLLPPSSSFLLPSYSLLLVLLPPPLLLTLTQHLKVVSQRSSTLQNQRCSRLASNMKKNQLKNN
jgi:hypothetical protein